MTSERIATRLVRLYLQPSGALPKTPLLASATRAALLTDLALSGALSRTETELDVDPAPTGYRPADRLLTEVVRHPDRTVEWWLRRGPDSVTDVITELQRTGIWARHGLGHRYQEQRPHEVRDDHAQLRAALDGTPVDAATASLAALVQVSDARQHGGPPSDELLLSCAPAGWLVAELVEYLRARRALLNAAASEARMAMAMNFI